MKNRKPPGEAPGAILNQLMEIARVSALAEMASGISHEINQPLGAIAAFSQAGERLLNRPDPLVERATEVFRHISHEALNAGAGIRRIRRLFDPAESARTGCDMGELIAEMRPVLEMLAVNHQGTLRVDTTPQPPLQIERLRIQHVLFALVQNAFEATVGCGRPPSVTVSVSGDRYNVDTRIDDNGGGVPAEIEDQLFKPFFTTKPRGTGLGLASCRAIVEAHEGSLGFERLATGGSRFWIRLPVSSP
jgi:C4-dicarboxylate-specific signal transduction histidine kinase